MEACCNLIAIIEEMEIQQENYEKDYDFLSNSVKLLSRSLHYLNNLRLQTTFREMLKSPVNSERILQEQLKESPELQKLRLQNCLTKVCYFVKLSGSNPRNGMLFLEAQDLLYEYTHHAELYSKELLNSHVVKEFDVEALQAYALVNSVREGVMHHKPMSDFGVLLKKL
ncbi:MAG: hypothetical protein JST59_00875 [Actinobacteria bacterium]|nr:hypothetical protein [Actinomycetota bacterium]